jgi:hypothetical protein
MKHPGLPEAVTFAAFDFSGHGRTPIRDNTDMPKVSRGEECVCMGLLEIKAKAKAKGKRTLRGTVLK